MNNREIKFNGFQAHAWLHKAYKRLSSDELNMAYAFIRENAHLNQSDFEFKVNRMFIDKPKPKNFIIILELLTCCNHEKTS